MRGGPPPSVLDDNFRSLPIFLPWEGLRPLWRRVRGGRRYFDAGPFANCSTLIWSLFRTFSQLCRIFGGFLSHHSFFDRFFSILRVEQLGLGRFWEGLGGSWAPLGPHWVPLGRSWAPLGRLLGICLGCLPL